VPGGSASPYGKIVFTDVPYDDGAAAKTSAGFVGTVKHFFGAAVTSTVTIVNGDLPGYFGSSAYNAELTILHELGHVLSNLNFKNDQITPDGLDPSGKVSTDNDNKIKAACGQDLSKQQ